MSTSTRVLGTLALVATLSAAGDAFGQFPWEFPCLSGSSWRMPAPTERLGGSHLRVEGGDELQNEDAITLDLWFRAESLHDARLLSKGVPTAPSNNRTYHLSLHADGRLVIEFSLLPAPNFSRAVIVSPPVVQPLTWHRVVATFDSAAGEARLYVDGILQGATSQDDHGLPLQGQKLRKTTLPLQIGGAPALPAQTLVGAVDEVRIWARALPHADVLATAQAPLDGLDGLTASFHLDDSFLDLSGGHVAVPEGPGTFAGKCASFGHYGQGIPIAFGIVPYLSVDLPPYGGSVRYLLIGNPTGVTAPVLLVVGNAPAQLPAFGGTLLAQPQLTTLLTLPPLGFGIPFQVPKEDLLVYVQSFLPDPTAVQGVSASRGLFLHVGI